MIVVQVLGFEKMEKIMHLYSIIVIGIGYEEIDFYFFGNNIGNIK